uniref:Uncharacterized protein n=1 Tax=Timema monikensis TaxID=170555 RepID=A0A7R9EBZ6_9NEOP|nr:unnamed protein product [Timema monikensis]
MEGGLLFTELQNTEESSAVSTAVKMKTEYVTQEVVVEQYPTLRAHPLLLGPLLSTTLKHGGSVQDG